MQCLREELNDVAQLSAADIVARHDLALAIARFGDLLNAAEGAEEDPDAIAARYAALAGGWRRYEDADQRDPLPDLGVLDVFEMAGTIKWFDAAKGYGFIAPDNGLPEVLLHVTCLRAGGYQTALAGARVVCEVLRRPKGMQAFRILHMDESTAIHPAQLPARQHVVVDAESGWERAMVKWFNRVRGFGFLSCGEGTADIFVPLETVRRSGFAELRPGQMVEVRWGMSSKGRTAAELRPLEGRLRSASH
jgi:CspA family cold shock protein